MHGCPLWPAEHNWKVSLPLERGGVQGTEGHRVWTAELEPSIAQATPHSRFGLFPAYLFPCLWG